MRRAISVLASLYFLLGLPALAQASTALEYPDNGVAQFSRGGAWLATASDPIAGHYNPAALATQTTSFGVGLNLAFQKICFERRGAQGEAVGPSAAFTSQGLTYEEVCNTNAGQPNAVPNVAFVWRAAERLGIGLTVVPPSSFGQLEWPDLVPPPAGSSRTAPIPAPQRYLSLYTKGTILFPTLSVGYSVTDRVHVGAGFVAGFALLETRSMSMGNVESTNPRDNFTTDSLSEVKARDLFVPGFVAGALVEATRHLDLAAWYRYSDRIRARGDLEVTAQYYNAAGVKNPNATPSKSLDQVGEDAARIVITLPMEARLGARWHMPRKAASPREAEVFPKDRHRVRDPLRDDLYDLELDVTWANNGAARTTEVRFAEGIFVANLGTVPTHADRPTGWRDSFGARLGLQYNALRNRMGLRTGTWVETSAVKEEYLSVTGVPALRGGLAVGLVFRVQRVDLETGYQHGWNAGLDNGGHGAQKAIAATGNQPENRSFHAVNGGRVSQHANVFSAGAVARF